MFSRVDILKFVELFLIFSMDLIVFLLFLVIVICSVVCFWKFFDCFLFIWSNFGYSVDSFLINFKLFWFLIVKWSRVLFCCLGILYNCNNLYFFNFLNVLSFVFVLIIFLFFIFLISWWRILLELFLFIDVIEDLIICCLRLLFVFIFVCLVELLVWFLLVILEKLFWIIYYGVFYSDMKKRYINVLSFFKFWIKFFYILNINIYFWIRYK